MKKNKNKELSSRGRAESSDVLISCDKVLMNKKNPEKTKTVMPDLIGYLSRFFNLIRRSLEFFAFAQVAPAKNRDDSLLFLDSPWTRFSEIATSAFRLLAMTIPTLALAAVLAIANISESRAEIIKENNCDCGMNCCVTITTTTNNSGEIVSKHAEIYKKPNATTTDFEIGYSAFRAQGLTSVNIPEGVTYIGGFAFSRNNLTVATIPSTVNGMSEEAFSHNHLEKIQILGGSGNYDLCCGHLDGNEELKEVILADSVNIRPSLFSGVPDNLTIKCLGNLQNCETQVLPLVADENGKCLDNQFCLLNPTILSSDGERILCKGGYVLSNNICVPGYEWLDENTLVISDELPRPFSDIFGLSSGMPEKILCRGDVAKCKELLRNYPIYSGGGNPYGYGSSDYYPGYSAPYGGEYLGVDLGDYVEPATEENCESSRYYWSGSACNNKNSGINCDENFKQMETWCNRIRYTPADAAKVLKDTDNEIVMTFKVNR